MARRVGMPPDLMHVGPVEVYADPRWPVPELWQPRGRWKSGPMHTFTDDFRQEFFWRRPWEGRLVALSAGVCTAPDFSIYEDDPSEWATYQAWRSAVVAQFWQSAEVRVYPVMSFRGNGERYVRPGSAWAVRGPQLGSDHEWYAAQLLAWQERARPGLLVVFGRPLPANVNLRCAVVRRALVPARGNCTKSGSDADGRAGAKEARNARSERLGAGSVRRSTAGVRADAGV